MPKFQRNYLLTVQVDDKTSIDIGMPFTMEFTIERNTLASANTAKIKILNLGEITRNRIRKDKFSTTIYKGIELRAGYGEDKNILPLIFKGNIMQAYSRRNGTEYETTIDAYDGGYAFVNAYCAETFSEGTPTDQAINRLISALPAVNKGIIGDFSTPIPRGNSFNGNPTELLSNLTNGGFFIDNEKAYCLGENECIGGNIDLITSESGLLGSPLREDTHLTFQMLFEPRITVGQMIELKSSTEKVYNGLYKVMGFTHNGIISPVVSGQCITSVNLYYGFKELLMRK